MPARPSPWHAEHLSTKSALPFAASPPGIDDPIHAHPHRLLGRAIDGVLEEMRFEQLSESEVKLSSRTVLAHEELVETDGLSTLHVVPAHGELRVVDLQLRGPECGKPGRRLRLRDPFVDLAKIEIGAHVRVTEEIDDRPGRGGEGAAAGRLPSENP